MEQQAAAGEAAQLTQSVTGCTSTSRTFLCRGNSRTDAVAACRTIGERTDPAADAGTRCRHSTLATEAVSWICDVHSQLSIVPGWTLCTMKRPSGALFSSASHYHTAQTTFVISSQTNLTL